MLDQLDEQLHAGTTSYILTAKNRIASLSHFGVIYAFFMVPYVGFVLIARADQYHRIKSFFASSLAYVLALFAFGLSLFFGLTGLQQDSRFCYPFELLKKATQEA